MSNNQYPDGWTEMTFGEMAEQVSERVDDPKTAGVEVYVGLEHLDPEDLRIRRRGTPDDVEATKLRVRPGQIIFGKRRAYQRKVAVADFDGIASAHAMILQEKPALYPGFLPFFMQSDTFMDRAVTISEGGLSPTIKWKTLAAEKFLLPPPQQQRELVELMQGFERAIEAGEEVVFSVEKARSMQRGKLFFGSQDNLIRLAEIADVKAGQALSPSRRNGSSPRPYLRVENLKTNEITFDDVALMHLSDKELSELELRTGDTLLVGDNANPARVGIAAMYNDLMPNGVAFQNHLIRVRAKGSKTASPKYLFHLMRHLHDSGFFIETSSGTTIRHLKISKLMDGNCSAREVEFG